ncbi:MAG: acylphosphatase [Patescibacteria group bacterium]
MSELQHFNLRIFGRVIGVNFRSAARDKAKSLKLTGFVKNEADKTLYIEVEGESESLQKFIKWCHKGPFFAGVDKVEVGEDELKNFDEFKIIY